MRRLVVPGALVALLLVAPVTLASHGSIGWRSPDLRIIDATIWPDEIRAAAAEWSQSAVSLTVEPGRCQARRRFIVLCSGDYGPSGGAAGGVLDIRGGRITGVVIHFNTYYDAISVFPAMRDWIICHELGHAVGLNHDDVAFADDPDRYHWGCMNTRSQGNPAPSPHDLDELAVLYG